jgi:type III secretion system FlhB-like substrate exporter
VIVNDLAPGLLASDGVTRILQAAVRQNVALMEHTRMLSEFTAFTIDGTIPERLK